MAKSIFPKLARGGYGARIRFADEARGESFFDSEWDIRHYDEAGSFTIGCLMDYRGNIVYDAPAARTLGKALKAGDTVLIQPCKYTMRGRTPMAAVAITINSVAEFEDGTLTVTYERV